MNERHLFNGLTYLLLPCKSQPLYAYAAIFYIFTPTPKRLHTRLRPQQ